MTNKVYCVRKPKVSLVLLVSKPLKHHLIKCCVNKDKYGVERHAPYKTFPTGMTNKVYPIRKSLASLGKLTSNS